MEKFITKNKKKKNDDSEEIKEKDEQSEVSTQKDKTDDQIKEEKVMNQGRVQSYEIKDGENNLPIRLRDVDAITSIISTKLKKEDELELARKNTEIRELSSVALNDWNIISNSSSSSRVKIVNGIPSILKMKRDGWTDYQDDLLTTILPSSISQVKLIANSIKMFSSGTNLVTYHIESHNTFEPLTYDPESPPSTSLKLSSVLVSPLDGGQSRTDVYAGLMELILKLMKQGDVFIVQPTKLQLAAIQSDKILEKLRNEKIYESEIENILIGVAFHSCPWFRRDVLDKLSIDDMRFGTVATGEMIYGGTFKESEYAAVATDHIFATLHAIFMNQQRERRSDASAYERALKILAPFKSVINLRTDIGRDLYHIYKLTRSDAHAYIFGFLLSSAVRTTQYAYLQDYFKRMRGVREISSTDRLEIGIQGIDMFQVKASIEEVIKSMIRGLNINHWYQMCVAELTHAFIDPVCSINFVFSDIQTTVVALFGLALDALCFPNTFWSNIHIYSYILYTAWAFIANSESVSMLAGGYAGNYLNVRQLTKNEIREGIIPKIFNRQLNNAMPRFMGMFLGAIAPVGELYRLPLNDEEWCPYIKQNNSFYIPFTKERRERLGSAGNSLLYERINTVLELLSDMTNRWSAKHSQSRALTGQLLTTLMNYRPIARAFASMCHNEMHLLYKNAANGPEIIATHYQGETTVNVSNNYGICSAVPNPINAHRSCDPAVSVFPCIGLWGLLSLTSDHTDLKGVRNADTTSSFQFENPVIRYEHHEKMVTECAKVANAFGIMTEVITKSRDQNSKFSLLEREFGASLKSGTANLILEWIIPQVDLKRFIYGTQHNLIDSSLNDLRFTSPKVCRINSIGTVMDPLGDDIDIFERPLILIDNYDRMKLDVAVEVVASESSPIHRYGKGLIVGKGRFETLTPDNRHSDDVEVVMYDIDDNSWTYQIVGKDLKVCFNYRGNIFHGVHQQDFPENIRLTLENPHLFDASFWTLVKDAIDVKNWQVDFPNVQYIAKVLSLTSDQAIQYNSSQVDAWQVLRELKPGEVIAWTFLDTTKDILNNKVDLKLPSGIQYVCAVESVDRNIVVRGIIGKEQFGVYTPPKHNMWSIGTYRAGEIPYYNNGIPKYLGADANFNNVVKIYTDNVKIDEKPIVIYIPPSGDQLV